MRTAADSDCPRPEAVTFRTLGTLELRVAGAPVRIGADKQRVLLAMLLAHDGRAVPVPVLIREIWGDDPPPSAVANLRTYVMQLRRRLPAGEARLATSRSGYVLRVDDTDFDIPRVRAKAADARRAVAQRQLPEAAELYTQALALWRGLPLENVTQGPALRGFTQHLSELHLSIVEEQVGVETALGRHGTVIQHLRHVIKLHPLHERLRGRLMLALYSNGDVAGALGAFTEARNALREELGMDPGEELSRLHRAILRRDPALLPGPPATGPTGPVGPAGPAGLQSVPRQLPPESTVFVGRQQEIAAAREALRAGPTTTVSAPTVVFHGQGGFGKSALALRHAHDLAPLYPDGQLYADLTCPTPQGHPPRPFDIITGFLRALGVPPPHIPDTTAEASLRYQSMLAGRRLLIVADNALDASQIRPLIPANNACAVLATSRSSLPTLLATRIAVGTLDETSSVRLLALIGTGERFAREHDATVELARLCGHHALALRIAAARLVARPEWSLAGFAGRLRHRAQRLDELQAEGLSVRACIAQSYRRLLRTPLTGRARSARAFQLLGLFDHAEFDLTDAAALLGTDTRQAAGALDELVDAQLIEPVTENTFRMHELIRLYAAELATPAGMLPHRPLPAVARHKQPYSSSAYVSSPRPGTGSQSRSGVRTKPSRW
ncbi:BTAD domain-containing putative transcriptional regulator [Streptomyces sp. NPDC058572]|uniref:AfsR/SARP family transcriptional regulator n=1 Tax=Streptomyces sp. NPDC058572 TaxID=3346546 RepID=UPI003665626D